MTATLPRILLVEDEQAIRKFLRTELSNAQYQLDEAATADQALKHASQFPPDLVILDLGLPDMDGAAVCKSIRSWSTAPIIVLSARGSVQEKADLLDLGADDYIAKPFSTVELQARVRAQLRRARISAASDEPHVIEADGASIDLAKPSVKRDGVAVHLTKTEWELLRTLIKNAGRTMTHRQLFHAVWGNSHGDVQQYLRVHIRSIRRKIERDSVRPKLIITEPGVGYRFESDA